MPELGTIVQQLRELLDLPERAPSCGGASAACSCGCAHTHEESKMDPFKKKARLGPGPYGRKVQRRRKSRFKCACKPGAGATVCKCKSRTGDKRVIVSHDYKEGYNAKYRAWQKKRKRTKAPKPKSFLKRVKER